MDKPILNRASSAAAGTHGGCTLGLATREEHVPSAIAEAEDHLRLHGTHEGTSLKSCLGLDRAVRIHSACVKPVGNPYCESPTAPQRLTTPSYVSDMPLALLSLAMTRSVEWSMTMPATGHVPSIQPALSPHAASRASEGCFRGSVMPREQRASTCHLWHRRDKQHKRLGQLGPNCHNCANMSQ